MNKLFMAFLESLKTPSNKALVECIKNGFKTIVEASIDENGEIYEDGRVVNQNREMTLDDNPVRFDENGDPVSVSGNDIDTSDIDDGLGETELADTAAYEDDVEPDLVDFLNGQNPSDL